MNSFVVLRPHLIEIVGIPLSTAYAAQCVVSRAYTSSESPNVFKQEQRNKKTNIPKCGVGMTWIASCKWLRPKEIEDSLINGRSYSRKHKIPFDESGDMVLINNGNIAISKNSIPFFYKDLKAELVVNKIDNPSLEFIDKNNIATEEGRRRVLDEYKALSDLDISASGAKRILRALRDISVDDRGAAVVLARQFVEMLRQDSSDIDGCVVKAIHCLASLPLDNITTPDSTFTSWLQRAKDLAQRREFDDFSSSLSCLSHMAKHTRGSEEERTSTYRSMITNTLLNGVVTVHRVTQDGKILIRQFVVPGRPGTVLYTAVPFDSVPLDQPMVRELYPRETVSTCFTTWKYSH